MRKYRVTGRPLYLNAGIIELTEEQAHPRLPVLKALDKKDQYEITGQVCFKVGEIIGCGAMAKTLTDFLEPWGHSDADELEGIHDTSDMEGKIEEHVRKVKKTLVSKKKTSRKSAKKK
jgi:tRNA splicing ligase